MKYCSWSASSWSTLIEWCCRTLRKSGMIRGTFKESTSAIFHITWIRHKTNAIPSKSSSQGLLLVITTRNKQLQQQQQQKQETSKMKDKNLATITSRNNSVRLHLVNPRNKGSFRVPKANKTMLLALVHTVHTWISPNPKYSTLSVAC